MNRDMDATLNRHGYQAATSLLLRHCLSLGNAEGRIPARLRLEEAIGPDMAHRLVTSLTARSSRREPVA
jgi:hypothetical protein